MTNTTSRRALLGAAAALVSVPAVAVAAQGQTSTAGGTTISALWNEVMDLTVRLGAHARDIAAAERPNGVPGWMYLSGEANALGNKRYDALVAILKAKPETAEDLATIARVALHRDIVDGPKSFAANRLAQAAVTLQAA